MTDRRYEVVSALGRKPRRTYTVSVVSLAGVHACVVYYAGNVVCYY